MPAYRRFRAALPIAVEDEVLDISAPLRNISRRVRTHCVIIKLIESVTSGPSDLSSGDSNDSDTSSGKIACCSDNEGGLDTDEKVEEAHD